MLQCSSYVFTDCGTFVVADHDRISALARMDSHETCYIDSKWVKQRTQQQWFRLLIGCKQKGKKLKTKSSLSTWTCLEHKLMTDGDSVVHTLPVWLTLSGTQCSSQHNTTSCVQLQSTDMHTHTLHTLIK